MNPAAFRAVVVGGSVGGMAAAVRLRRIGADVAVYERSAAVMESRAQAWLCSQISSCFLRKKE